MTQRGLRWRWGVGLLATLTLATAMLTTAPGTAMADDEGAEQAQGTDPDQIPPDLKAQMDAQQPLIAAADKIRTAVEEGSPAGYTGVELGDTSVIVWWKGTIPADIQAAIDDARLTAPVEVRTAAHTKADVDAKAYQLGMIMEEDPASYLNRVLVSVDGSGVTGVLNPGTRSKVKKINDRLYLSPDGVTSVPAGSTADDVPIALEEQPAVESLAGPATRWNDGWNGSAYGSFAGGGAITTPYAGKTVQCTAGFGVVKGNEEFLLTAAHCGYIGQFWANGNNSRTVGLTRYESTPNDLLLISSDANRYMWDGGGKTNTFTKRVTGWDWAHVGELVCFSGALTGANCGWKNSRNFAAKYCATDAYGSRECYSDLIYATKSGATAQKGDSGAPVFYTNGGPTVTAKGIISGGSSGVLLYQDFGTAYRLWGLRPIT